MIKQIQNVLPNRLAQDIREILLSPYFPWYFNDEISGPNQNSQTSFQFIHGIYKQDNGWTSDPDGLFHSMLYLAEDKLQFSLENIIRMKANLLTMSSHSPAQSDIHQDVEIATEDNDGYLSLLYYVDDSDGDTLIFDRAQENIIQRITPKFNSAILFDSTIWHSSSPPLKNKRRVVINTIMKTKNGNFNF